jgi:hypothetical protein
MTLRVAATITVLLAAISVPIGTSAADQLDDFYRERGIDPDHPRQLTATEWCTLALLQRFPVIVVHSPNV